jgi:hypothetical protein
MKHFRTFLCLLIFALCSEGAHGASWEQSDPRAARAFGSGNLEQVKRIFADPDRARGMETNIPVLLDAYAKAVESGSVPLLEYLDTRGWLARLREADEENATLILAIAAMNGHNGVIDYLASQHVDIHAINKELGYTAMHAAVSSGRLQTVQHLCELGLDPGIRSREGKTVLELAEYSFRVSSRGGPEETAIYKESLRRIVEYLKDKGPDGCKRT